MKSIAAFLVVISLALISPGLAQEKTPPKPDPKTDPEQAELNQALADAGPSGVDFIRALENHLKKYPNSTQKAAIERAIVKAAIESKDDKRLIEYGERVLKAEPVDLQVLDKVTRALLMNDDRESANKALGFAIRYQLEIETIAKQPAPGRYSEAQWKEELSKGLARALVYQARANGNQGKYPEAIELARKSWDTYPTAGAARESGRWLAKTGKNMAAVEAIADAFTIEDPASTEIDRGKDRIKMGELYQKASGSETGLGDIVLKAYDRTSAVMSERTAKLRAADPNLKASKITEFTLTGVTGEKLSLASLRGKTVVLDFWATWCGPCRIQHPLYEKAAERFKENPNVVFLAVATDEDRDVVAPFLKDHKWTNRVFYESGLSRTLEISSIPTTIIVDKNGNIASRMNGFTPERFVDLLTERINDTLKN
jgi:thiol-disulfide isomerase/thioredoxin